MGKPWGQLMQGMGAILFLPTQGIIYGGSNEIQRNIISKHLLNL